MKCAIVLLAATLATVVAVAQQGTPLTDHQQQARAIFKELIEINTTDTPAGNVTKASEALAARLRAAGFAGDDVQVIGPSEKKRNLVARIRGTGAGKPILLISH